MATKLHPEVDRRLRQLARYARDWDIPFRVTSTVRSSAKQQQLYNAWIARGRTGLPAAPPGLSTHEYGFAFDAVPLRAHDRDGLVLLAKCAGFRWAGLADPVHFDVFGPPVWRNILAGMGGRSVGTGTPPNC